MTISKARTALKYKEYQDTLDTLDTLDTCTLLSHGAFPDQSTDTYAPMIVPTPCSGKAASGNVQDYEEHGENKSRLWIFDPYLVIATHGKGGRSDGLLGAMLILDYWRRSR